MNKIILKGVIDNIEYSHTINSIDFYKAVLNIEDGNTASICFKHETTYENGDTVSLVGSIRSFTKRYDDKSKVDIYIFTYFDEPEEEKQNLINSFELDGRICKMDKLRLTKDGRKRMHITLANNIFSANDTQKLNNYIPIVAYDELAESLSTLQVSDRIQTTGYFCSRTYIKNTDEGEEEKVAYEGILSSLEVV